MHSHTVKELNLNRSVCPGVVTQSVQQLGLHMIHDAFSVNDALHHFGVYRAPLTSRLADELFDAVKLDNGWKEDTEMVEKIPVLTFRNVLKRFMFRYLSVDQFRPDVHLELYLTDPRLVRWPADAVDEAVVDECFPSNLLLQHSYATYMLLAEVSPDFSL